MGNAKVTLTFRKEGEPLPKKTPKNPPLPDRKD
jgi:hypothetical protein